MGSHPVHSLCSLTTDDRLPRARTTSSQQPKAHRSAYGRDTRMCLFSIKKEEDEDVRVTRRVRRTSRYEREYSPSRRSYDRVSIRASQPTIVVPPPAPLPLPAPTGKVLPAPQPVPQFESPPLSPPEVHYVHVSPRSSVSSHSHRDYYEYRHVDAPEPEVRYRRRERSRSRSRAPSRSHYDDHDDREYDRTNVRVSRRSYDDRR